MYPAPPKQQAALYGGLFIGVLSALPVINVGNCFCCMWVIGGGVLATYLMQQNHPYPITAADGALVGLLAGLVGGAVGTLLSIPIDMMIGPYMKQLMERMIASNPDFPSETRTMLENMNVGAPGVAGTLIKLVSMMFIGVVFGLLGGLLGVALFKKKDAPPPPGTVEILPPV